MEGLEARREVCGVRACLEETKGSLEVDSGPYVNINVREDFLVFFEGLP